MDNLQVFKFSSHFLGASSSRNSTGDPLTNTSRDRPFFLELPKSESNTLGTSSKGIENNEISGLLFYCEKHSSSDSSDVSLLFVSEFQRRTNSNSNGNGGKGVDAICLAELDIEGDGPVYAFTGVMRRIYIVLASGRVISFDYNNNYGMADSKVSRLSSEDLPISPDERISAAKSSPDKSKVTVVVVAEDSAAALHLYDVNDFAIGGGSVEEDEDALEDDARCLTLCSELNLLEALSEGAECKDALVNVGWGSKKTQFHGSAGKEAALIEASLSKGQLCLEDVERSDPFGHICIDWRGDASYFCLSLVNPFLSLRQLLVLDGNDGSLCSKSEPSVGFLLPGVAWQPKGNFIATIRQESSANDNNNQSNYIVQLFERNGLKRHSFNLQLSSGSSKVLAHSMSWSSDSEILAIPTSDRGIFFYRSSNYEWMCRYHLPPISVGLISPKFSQLESNLYHLVIEQSASTNSLLSVTFTRREGVDPFCKSQDGLVLAHYFNEGMVRATPFAQANIPPPFSKYQVWEKGAPLGHIILERTFFILWSQQDNNSSSDSTSLQWKLYDSATGSELLSLAPFIFQRGHLFHGLSFISYEESSSVLTVLIQTWNIERGCSEFFLYQSSSDALKALSCGEGKEDSFSLIMKRNGLVQSMRSGSIYNFYNEMMAPIVTSAQSRFSQLTLVKEKSLLIALGHEGSDDEGKLFYLNNNGTNGTNGYNNGSNGLVCVANSVSGFLVDSGHPLASNYLIVNSRSEHSAYFLSLDSNPNEWINTITNASNNSNNNNNAVRKLERGSRLITVMEGYKLLLQMPRGNCETIYPRALVLKKIEALLSLAVPNYGEAFALCRKHRIESDLLYEFRVKKLDGGFDAGLLVSQILSKGKRDSLNLFISNVSKSNVPKICPLILHELYLLKQQQQDNAVEEDVLEPLLTVLVKLERIEEAFTFIIRSFKGQRDLLERSLTYLIFLVDVDQIYRFALGTYDLSLALQVAQLSQMDPKEYISLLQGFHAIPEGPLLRFNIDEYLGRWSSALQQLLAIQNYDESLLNKYILRSNSSSNESDLSLFICQYVRKHALEWDFFKWTSGGKGELTGKALVLLAERIEANAKDSVSVLGEKKPVSIAEVVPEDDLADENNPTSSSSSPASSWNDKEKNWFLSAFANVDQGYWKERANLLRCLSNHHHNLEDKSSIYYPLVVQVEESSGVPALSALLRELTPTQVSKISPYFLSCLVSSGESLEENIAQICNLDVKGSSSSSVISIRDLIFCSVASRLFGRLDLMETLVIPYWKQMAEGCISYFDDFASACQEDLRRLSTLLATSNAAIDDEGDGDDEDAIDPVMGQVINNVLKDETNDDDTNNNNNFEVQSSVTSILSLMSGLSKASTGISTLLTFNSSRSSVALSTASARQQKYKSGKAKRKAQRNKYLGKVGSVYERESLLKRLLAKLLGARTYYQNELVPLLDYGLILSSNMHGDDSVKIRELARSLVVKAQLYYNLLLNPVSQVLVASLDSKSQVLEPLLTKGSLLLNSNTPPEYINSLLERISLYYEEEMLPLQLALQEMFSNVGSGDSGEKSSSSINGDDMRRWKRMLKKFNVVHESEEKNGDCELVGDLMLAFYQRLFL